MRLIWQAAFIFFLMGLDAHAAQWSKTEPAINLTHIFEGEVNSRGKAVGFHARPFGQDPQNAHLSRLIAGPNQQGVYTGASEIYDKVQARWRYKSFSSFFPDQLSREYVVKLILEAYKNANVTAQGKWRGASGAGFRIEGLLCPPQGTPNCPKGAINTAYPIYRKD